MRAVGLSSAPLSVVLAGKNAAPLQSAPDPANITTISPHETSSPITWKYVEQSGVTWVSSMLTSTTRAVNAPVSENSRPSQFSKSVRSPVCSEVDTRRLRYVMFEQHPEWLLARLREPIFECGQRPAYIGHILFSLRRQCHKHCSCYRCKLRQHFIACFALTSPAESVGKHCLCARHRRFLAVRANDRVYQALHQVDAAKGEGASLLERGDRRGRLASKRSLGSLRVACIRDKILNKRMRYHRAPREDGGREWESNPPKTGSRPFTDLKSERPT